jgi:hypothetical protein
LNPDVAYEFLKEHGKVAEFEANAARQQKQGDSPLQRLLKPFVTIRA